MCFFAIGGNKAAETETDELDFNPEQWDWYMLTSGIHLLQTNYLWSGPAWSDGVCVSARSAFLLFVTIMWFGEYQQPSRGLSLHGVLCMERCVLQYLRTWACCESVFIKLDQCGGELFVAVYSILFCCCCLCCSCSSQSLSYLYSI